MDTSQKTSLPADQGGGEKDPLPQKSRIGDKQNEGHGVAVATPASDAQSVGPGSTRSKTIYQEVWKNPKQKSRMMAGLIFLSHRQAQLQ